MSLSFKDISESLRKYWCKEYKPKVEEIFRCYSCGEEGISFIPEETDALNMRCPKCGRETLIHTWTRRQ